MNLTWKKYRLDFRIPAKTSRGEYSYKEIYLISLTEKDFTTTAEISPLPDLSIDGQINLDEVLESVNNELSTGVSLEKIIQKLNHAPSVQFALVCCKRCIQNSNGFVADTAFTRGESGIPVNGLVWMDDIEEMEQSAIRKINEGFNCIKFKVGKFQHDDECRLIERIKNLNPEKSLEIRIDSNGAYHPDDALLILRDFKRLGVHSIEQPVKSGQWEILEELCAKSTLDIALDEELIGINEKTHGEKLLRKVKPDYLVLKPTMLGGFERCEFWIDLCNRLNIGWWVTSALESNVGLTHIAQWLSGFSLKSYQGLGTGGLYTNNFHTGVALKGDTLYFNP